MFLYNNAQTPRRAGGYSVDSYEPAIINSNNQKAANDLIEMTFTERRNAPTPTTGIMYSRMTQYNIAPAPVIQNVNYNPLPKVSVLYTNPIANPVQIINQNPNNSIIYRLNNVSNVYPMPTVRSLNNNGRSNPIVYQNLIMMNNAYNNAVVPSNYITGLNVIPNIRPIFTSNSANASIILSPTLTQSVMVPPSIIQGPQYKTNIYKKSINIY